ncbi:hypothetical protein K439DRAFT_1615635 [Ramaria rubella]|nr:hypothetical protein K439DRAFT_1615635 [Ramaria rubella]
MATLQRLGLVGRTFHQGLLIFVALANPLVRQQFLPKKGNFMTLIVTSQNKDPQVSQTVSAALALWQAAVDTCINGRTTNRNSFIKNAFPLSNDGERSYLVILEPRLKIPPNCFFCVVMKSWPESTPMASITQYALDGYNEVWTKTMDFLLQPCYIQLRWHGNRTILENSADKLLGKFYQQHWEDRMIYFTIPNKYKSYMKGSIVITLEAFINTVKVCLHVHE